MIQVSALLGACTRSMSVSAACTPAPPGKPVVLKFAPCSGFHEISTSTLAAYIIDGALGKNLSSCDAETVRVCEPLTSQKPSSKLNVSNTNPMYRLVALRSNELDCCKKSYLLIERMSPHNTHSPSAGDPESVAVRTRITNVMIQPKAEPGSAGMCICPRSLCAERVSTSSRSSLPVLLTNAEPDIRALPRVVFLAPLANESNDCKKAARTLADGKRSSSANKQTCIPSK
jgi:hypothetical protein